MMSLPVWLPGPMFLPGVCVQRVSVWGASVQSGLCRETPQNQKSGRYASYWNAFLFGKIIPCVKILVYIRTFIIFLIKSAKKVL